MTCLTPPLWSYSTIASKIVCALLQIIVIVIVFNCFIFLKKLISVVFDYFVVLFSVFFNFVHHSGVVCTRWAAIQICQTHSFIHGRAPTHSHKDVCNNKKEDLIWSVFPLLPITQFMSAFFGVFVPTMTNKIWNFYIFIPVCMAYKNVKQYGIISHTFPISTIKYVAG